MRLAAVFPPTAILPKSISSNNSQASNMMLYIRVTSAVPIGLPLCLLACRSHSCVSPLSRPSWLTQDVVRPVIPMVLVKSILGPFSR